MKTQNKLFEEILRCMNYLELSWEETKEMLSFEQGEDLLMQLKRKIVGDRLKKARERLQLSIPAVSDDLMMPILIIERIESGEIEAFYKEIFALKCRYSVPAHEIFQGFFDHSSRFRSSVENSLKSTDKKSTPLF